MSDLDGDDDLDLVGLGTWYENDGDGQFELSHTFGPAHSGVHAADLDGDGDNDVVTVSGQRFGQVIWYENTDGNGLFVLNNVVATLDWRLQSLQAVDMDDDGDADILSATGSGFVVNSDGQLLWHENIDGSGTFGDSTMIHSGGTNNALAADLDGDGDMDVLSSSPEFGTAWHENTDGVGGFGSPIPMSRSTHITGSIVTGDMDGDGDLDALSIAVSISFGIDWYENRIIGDSNNDRRFDSGDLVKVFQAGQYEDGVQGNSTFDEGDWNADGDFDSGDLVFVFQSGTFVAAARLSSIAVAIDAVLATENSVWAARDDDVNRPHLINGRQPDAR